MNLAKEVDDFLHRATSFLLSMPFPVNPRSFLGQKYLPSHKMTSQCFLITHRHAYTGYFLNTMRIKLIEVTISMILYSLALMECL